MDEVVPLVKLTVVCEAFPETFETIVKERCFYMLSFLRVIAQFAGDVLDPPLKILIILRQFI